MTFFVSFYWYIKLGDGMEIYVDLVLALNFLFDFIILLSVSYILRRNVSLKKIVFGSLVGEFSLLLLFIRMPNLVFLMAKFFLSFVMIFVTFGYKDLRYFFKNILYFYLVSMLLGGAIEFLDNQFSYSNNGMAFYDGGLSGGYLIILVFGIFLFYKYVKSFVSLKNHYSYYHKCNIYGVKLVRCF